MKTGENVRAAIGWVSLAVIGGFVGLVIFCQFGPGLRATRLPIPRVASPEFHTRNLGNWIERAGKQADQDVARLRSELPRCKARFEVSFSTLSGPAGASIIITGVVASRADERDLQRFVGSLGLQTRVKYDLVLLSD